MANACLRAGAKESAHGETHPAAKLSDHEVELIRRLHEVDGWGYRRLVAKFEISKTQVRRICHYQQR